MLRNQRRGYTDNLLLSSVLPVGFDFSHIPTVVTGKFRQHLGVGGETNYLDQGEKTGILKGRLGNAEIIGPLAEGEELEAFLFADQAHRNPGLDESGAGQAGPVGQFLLGPAPFFAVFKDDILECEIFF
jgi:hypothetical protein